MTNYNMTNVEQYPGLPAKNYEVLDSNALLAAAAQGEWFEQSFVDTEPLTQARVLAVLRKDVKNLADFAEKTKMFFVGIIKVDPESESSQWTIMPGQRDREIASAASEVYAERLKGATAHFIIGPSGDDFSNSEDIGVMDRDITDCRFAVDVTAKDGLALDDIVKSPGKITFLPGVWTEWNGRSAVGEYSDFEAYVNDRQDVVLRQNLLAGMRAALGK